MHFEQPLMRCRHLLALLKWQRSTPTLVNICISMRVVCHAGLDDDDDVDGDVRRCKHIRSSLSNEKVVFLVIDIDICVEYMSVKSSFSPRRCSTD